MYGAAIRAEAYERQMNGREDTMEYNSVTIEPTSKAYGEIHLFKDRCDHCEAHISAVSRTQA